VSLASGAGLIAIQGVGCDIVSRLTIWTLPFLVNRWVFRHTKQGQMASRLVRALRRAVNILGASPKTYMSHFVDSLGETRTD
jgi:hypothetical protein